MFKKFFLLSTVIANLVNASNKPNANKPPIKGMHRENPAPETAQLRFYEWRRNVGENYDWDVAHNPCVETCILCFAYCCPTSGHEIFDNKKTK